MDVKLVFLFLMKRWTMQKPVSVTGQLVEQCHCQVTQEELYFQERVAMERLFQSTEKLAGCQIDFSQMLMGRSPH